MPGVGADAQVQAARKRSLAQSDGQHQRGVARDESRRKEGQKARCRADCETAAFRTPTVSGEAGRGCGRLSLQQTRVARQRVGFKGAH